MNNIHVLKEDDFDSNATSPQPIPPSVSASVSPVPKKQTILPAPLHEAVKSNDAKWLDQLLKSKVYDVNGLDSLGMTPLHYAASYGYHLLAETLIVRHCHGILAIEFIVLRQDPWR